MKYIANENFFLHDTPESLYWAGFIAADGCVSYPGKNKTSGFLAIGLSSVDRDMLQKFQKCIDFDGFIKDKLPTEHNPNGTSRIQISKINMVKSLERFNIVPNKTKIYTFPNWLINHSLINHFMRGYADGDGSFFITNQSDRNHLCFSLCGTKEFLTIYRDILAKECDLKLNKICKSKGIWDLRYSGNTNTFKIREFLYKYSSNLIRMGRKYDKAYDSSLGIIPRNEYKFRPIEGYKFNKPEVVYRFSCIKDVERLGLKSKSVQAVCAGKRQQIKGYTWQYIIT